MEPVHAVIMVFLCGAFYFLPTFVAGFRDKADGALGIFLLNLFAGWTAIGWLVCFIWAFTGRTKADLARERKQHAELLAALKRCPGDFLEDT